MYTLNHLDAVRHAGERPMQAVYVEALTRHGDVLRAYGITTAAHAAMVLGQTAHETGGYTILRENMRYTAARIRQVWPSRPEAVAYAGDPRRLANSVYGSRMGNRPGTDDGYDFRGKGLAQHTGRDGYRAVARLCGYPIDVPPADLVITDPLAAAHALGGYWQWKRLAEVCPDTSEAAIVAVTRRWNGGRIGLADRIVRVRAAARAMGQTLPPISPAAPGLGAAVTPAGAPAAVAVGSGVAASGTTSGVTGATDPDVAAGLALLGVLAVVAILGVVWWRIRAARADLARARDIETGLVPASSKSDIEGDQA